MTATETVKTNNFTAIARDADGRRTRRGSVRYERPVWAPSPTLDGNVGGWKIGPPLEVERPPSELSGKVARASAAVRLTS